jgi:hypothetical protein
MLGLDGPDIVANIRLSTASEEYGWVNARQI